MAAAYFAIAFTEFVFVERHGSKARTRTPLSEMKPRPIVFWKCSHSAVISGSTHSDFFGFRISGFGLSCTAHFLSTPFMNGLNRSIGTGRNVVVLCSLEISRIVCRNRNCRAMGSLLIMEAA
jgi:hypothetical protein